MTTQVAWVAGIPKERSNEIGGIRQWDAGEGTFDRYNNRS